MSSNRLNKQPSKLAAARETHAENVLPLRQKAAGWKLQSTNGTTHEPDVLHVNVADLHWLQVSWTVAASSVQRAAAALNGEWHRAVGVLRVEELPTSDEDLGASPQPIMDLVLQPGSPTWFVRLADPHRPYRIVLGYRTPAGRFLPLIHSRTIITARDLTHHAGNPGRRDNDADAEATTHGLFPELWHAAPETNTARRVTAAVSDGLTLETELVVRGTTGPNHTITVEGKPVPVARDGRFQVRLPLQPGRHIIPATATRPDRSAEQTVVLAVEVNRRELEQRIFADEP